MRSYYGWGVALLLALLAAGCGVRGGSGALTPGAPGGAGAGFGLPTPQAVRESLPAPRATTAAVLSLAGSEFFPPAAQRVAAQDDAAVFSPQWAGNAAPSTDLACALYWFNLDGYNGPQTLALSWSAAPQDYGKLWIGFSDWTHGCWDWFPGTESGVLSPGGLAQYAASDSQELLVAVVLLGTAPAALQELRIGASLAGGWRMYGHDAQHTHRSETVSSQTGKLKWQVQSSAGGASGNAVFDAAGTAYIYSSVGVSSNEPGRLDAINPAGAFKWSYTPASWSYCTPAIGHESTVYFGNTQSVVALDGTGQEKWHFGSQLQCVDSVVLNQSDAVYFGAGSHSAYLYCLSNAGALVWDSYITGEFSVGCPAIAPDGTIYIAAVPGFLLAFQPDGERKWYYETWVAYDGGPSIGMDGTVYGGQWSPESVHAVNPDGSVKWLSNVDGDFSSSAALGVDGAVYVNWDDGYLYKIMHDGTLAWIAEAGGDSSPAIGADGVIYVGGQDYRLRALNSDGSLLWITEPAGGEFSDPAISDDGTLVVGNADGWIRAYGD